MTPVTGSAAIQPHGQDWKVTVDGDIVFTSKNLEYAYAYAAGWNHALYFVNKKSGAFGELETQHRLGDHAYNSNCLICNPGQGKGYTL